MATGISPLIHERRLKVGGRSIQIVLILFGALTAGCGHKSKSVSDLCSDLRALSSWTEQVDLFIGYIEDEKATNDYALGHVRYIDSEVKEAFKDLEEATAEPQLDPLLRECRQHYSFLIEQVGRLQLNLKNPSVLDDIKNEIQRIHAASERTRAIL